MQALGEYIEVSVNKHSFKWSLSSSPLGYLSKYTYFLNCVLFSNTLFMNYFNVFIMLGALGFFCVYCQKDLAVDKKINRIAKIIKTMVCFFFLFLWTKTVGSF